MLDTNIFDAIVKGSFPPDRLPSDGELCATAIQWEELKNTPDSELRSRLMGTCAEIIGSEKGMSHAAFSLDVAGAAFDNGAWRSNGALYDALKKALDDAWDRKPKKPQKRSKKENNSKDALIAEAAKFNDCVLLTRDVDLATVARDQGIKFRCLNSDGRSKILE